MLASNIVTIGDSWAWLIAANGPGSAPAAPGFTNSFQQMLDTFHPGSTVYNESFGGGLAAQHVVDLAGITSRINAHPDADIVWLSSGGNDIVGGSFVGGYTTLLNGAQKDALKNRIVNDVTTIANHILSIRPDIQVVIEGYDYINIWDTYSPVSAGDGNRVGLYGIVRYDTGFPQFDHAQNLAQNADFNSFMKDVGTGKNSIGINNSRIHYINNFGFHSSTFGYSGFLGNVPGTGSFPPDQYSALPTDDSFMNNGDPIHLNSAGYLNLTLRAQQEFFNTAMQNASLSTNTTSLNCGNVRVGDAGSSQTVTASNSGPNFTKVQSLVFPGASGQFTGSGSSHNPLFKDPTLGSDTATSAAYGFSPNARGNFNTNLTVTSDSGNRPLALAGNGVGPVYSSVSTLDLGTVFVDGSTSQSIDISNITTDGDLGMLTDLSLLTATITGPDAAAFSIDSFTPLTVVEAGATQGYMIQFDASGLTPGVKTATLTFTTDEGSSFGTLGSQFQVTLTAGVDPGVTASIGGPYSGDEGSSIPLSAAASTGATLYEWDLDNDGQYDDAVGENVNFSSPDNGVFNIHLRINGPGG
ncbi:MAG: choice-of-anchor D domain-containing protein, partial [Pirellulales bacterium]